jgi:putative ABC transport system substrate-binding protein
MTLNRRGPRMILDRRAVAALLLSFVAPGGVFGQAVSKLARIGILESDPTSKALESFRQGLHERGYFEGRNVEFEARWTHGVVATIPKLAEELSRLRVDVIFAPATPAALAAKEATRSIPIVFAVAADPVGSKLVATLAKPGGNVTGLTTLNIDVIPKRLEILNELAGGQARNWAVLFDPGDASNQLLLKTAEEHARQLGWVTRPFPVRSPSDFEDAFSAMVAAHMDAAIVSAGTLTIAHAKRLVDLAARSRIPAIYGSPEFVEAGGLVSYSGDFADNYRRAAGYVEKILKGARPEDLPVEQVQKLEFVLNQKTASALGLTVPYSLLLRVTRVID